MINATCYKQLVGFREPANPRFQIAEEPNSELAYLYVSDSGLYVTDVQQSLLDLETISRVKPEGKNLETYLSEIMFAATVDTLADFQKLRSAGSFARTLVDSVQVVKGAGYYRDKVTKSGRFVGFRLRMKDEADLAAIIRRIGLQTDSPQTDLKIYIYSTSQAEPVKIFNLNSNLNNSLNWIPVVNINEGKTYALHYNEMQGETLFIGYYEEDLNGYAIDKNGWSFAPCGCSYDPYKILSPHVTFTPISVPAGNLDPVNRYAFDPEQVHTEVGNFGLNLDLQLQCDLSGAFCDNKEQFAKAIQLKAAIKFLHEIYRTPNTNNLTLGAAKKDAFATAQEIQREYSEELKRINTDFSRVNSLCRPADRNSNVLSVGILGR